MSEVLRVEARDGTTVKLLEEQLEHILLKRPWITRHLNDVALTLQQPELVLEGAHGELLAVRHFEHLLGGKSLVAVYRVRGGEGFIITVYPTSDVDKAARRKVVVWRQRQRPRKGSD